MWTKVGDNVTILIFEYLPSYKGEYIGYPLEIDTFISAVYDELILNRANRKRNTVDITLF
jgi:hypothetical protein